MSEWHIRPRETECEVTVFGPGYGESILVHLGYNDWAVVDSCIDSYNKKAAALNYLERIGVDAAERVVVVAATHWDTDHRRGLAEIFRCASRAQFVCSAAHVNEEFYAILRYWKNASILGIKTGMDELEELMELIASRSPSAFPTPIRASVNCEVWSREARGRAYAASIKALAPSHAAVAMGSIEWRSLRAKLKEQKIRAVPKLDKPNSTSLVLCAQLNNTRILLGGDLEMQSDPGLGWKAILNDPIARRMHEAYKVAHHGSENADTEEIWSDLLHRNVFCVATPFVRGAKKLPSMEDTKRILSRTLEAFLTTPAKTRSYRDVDPTVTRLIRQFVPNVRAFAARSGSVSFRKDCSSADSEWKFKLNGEATRMQA